MTRRCAWACAAWLLITLGSAAAQDATTTNLASDQPPPVEDRQLWVLKGGGEILGRQAKQTPDAVFVDIGPEIIRIPRAAIVSAEELARIGAADAATTTTVGRGAGVFDAATGTLVFRGTQNTALRSQNEVLNEAKRSIVVVSNPSGRGSGFVLDTEGRVVTNQHVIGTERLHTVTIFVPKGGNQWDRKRFENVPVEAFSRLLDIAILKVDPAKVAAEGVTLYPLPIAAPDSLEPGDPVFAIGNPGMGGMLLTHSITEGIASSTTRNFEDILYVQTTAPVNPGNSGGPLMNARGEVVGLITFKAFFQEGIAFALPTSYMLHFVKHSRSFAANDENSNAGFRYLPPG